MARRANGEGSIYRRKDGRWEGAAWVDTTAGTRKRMRVYGQSHRQVHERLLEVKAQAQQGIPLPDQSWSLRRFFEHWLRDVVTPTCRPSTYTRYEQNVRLYLNPALGKHLLRRLSVSTLQHFFDEHLAVGHSVRSAHIMREVLSSALSHAMRKELVSRNVARLVKLPTYRRGKIYPWSEPEATAFLAAANLDPLYPAFALLLLYGLRLGEVLGLRWCDVDFEAGVLRIRQQLRRDNGELHQGPLKTETSERNLPLLELTRQVLRVQADRQDRARTAAANDWHNPVDGRGLVFTTSSGRPVEPRNFSRSFERICLQHNLRPIKRHHVRHTAATLLKRFGVPDRDVQLILGHSNISITQQVYQHADLENQRQGLSKLERVLASAITDNEKDGQPEVSRRGVAVAVRFSRQIPSLLMWRDWLYMEPTEGLEPTTRGLQSHPSLSSYRRITEIKSVLQKRTTQWILGAVAVSAAVKISS